MATPSNSTPPLHSDSDSEAEPVNLSINSNLCNSICGPTWNPNSNALTPATPNPTILHHLSINQNHSCFAVGLDTGLCIYQCDSYKQIMRRDNFEGKAGGIRFVAMLFRYNVMGLIVDKPNEVVIWDDHGLKCLGKLSYRSEVKNVKLRKDRIVVVLTQKVYVYNFINLRVLHEIDTGVNPKGLCEVSHHVGPMILVCPGLLKGQVRVEDYGSKKSKFIMAHISRISCIAMSLDGRFIATASGKGTLIRVFNTMDGSLLQEVRRGADRAEIYSLAFSSSTQWLAASSDKGTVHVFGLKANLESTPVPQPSTSSSLSFFKGALTKYFSSEWSVAQFRLKEGERYLVGFGKQTNTIVSVGMDGSYHKCEFDPENGGEMTQLEYYNFMKPEEAI